MRVGTCDLHNLPASTSARRDQHLAERILTTLHPSLHCFLAKKIRRPCQPRVHKTRRVHVRPISVLAPRRLRCTCTGVAPVVIQVVVCRMMGLGRLLHGLRFVCLRCRRGGIDVGGWRKGTLFEVGIFKLLRGRLGREP